jgi:Ca-activated chloride channel family protein
MEKKIKAILRDIYGIAPDLRDREDELKKTIEQLLASKPTQEINPGFKKELLDKILAEFGTKEPVHPVKRPLYFRPAFTAAVAASLLVLALGVILFLPKNSDQPTVETLAQNQAQKMTEPDKSPEPKRLEVQPAEPAPKVAVESGGKLEILVKLEDGSFIPGARVTLKDPGNSKRTTISNAHGAAVFTGLPPGKYRVYVDLEGFRAKKPEEVLIADNRDVSRDITLETSSYTETIIVSGKAPVIEVRKSSSAAGVLDKESQERHPKNQVQAPPTSDYKYLNYPKEANTESYDYIKENAFIDPLKVPLSTFSIDVDTASYSNVRRFLTDLELPPVDAVRIEEMVNYFPYDYPLPRKNKAFSITTEISVCPWNPEHHLVLVGLKGKDIEPENLPPSNLVFLVDVSGSMDEPEKLPLLIESFKLLTHELQPRDRVAIAVYAGSAGLVLPSTPGNDKKTIIRALDRLRAGGSTAGGEGIILAYDIAEKNFLKEGNNRVILATDGDFNVGPSSDSEMERLIEEKRKKGIFLTVLGFGMGNYKDSKMEKIADKGNGNYFYIDSILEANKVLVNDLRKTLFTIAKDVKIQVEFNPVRVKSYRLLGYENRLMAAEDFEDDTKDAGEIGAGHTVTALYEIVPWSKGEKPNKTYELRYLQPQIKTEAFNSTEWMNVKIRYKKPGGTKSTLLTRPLKKPVTPLKKASANLRFASSAAEFGLLLRNSPNKGKASFKSILDRASGALGNDQYGYRKEFLKLVKIAGDLKKESPADGEK